MNLQAEKLQLIQQILQINDAILLGSVKNLLGYALQKQENKAEAVSDFWDTLSAEQKIKVELSMEQLDNGKGIPHKKVMRQFREKYTM